MSVINQMLRDLDARAAGTNERAGLPAHLRTLPPSGRLRQQNWRMLGIGIGVGAVIAGGLVALLLRQDPAPATSPVVPAAAPAVPVPMAPPSVPPASTSGMSNGPTAAPIDLAEMKLSTLLSLAQQTLPEKAPVAKPVPPPVPGAIPAPPQAAEPRTATPPAPMPAPAPAKPAEVAKPVESAKSVKSVEPLKPPVQSKAVVPARPEPVAAEAQIDKRARGGQASEMAETDYRKGMQAVKRGDNAAAVPLFLRALELDPMLAKSRQALLSVLVGGRQWGEAQRVAQAGLALDPAQSGWAMILSRLQFEQGDAAGAVETLGRHAPYAQNDADYQGLFAYLLQKQQRPAEAAERFKAAVTLRPNEGRWWFGLGLALEGAGRGGEAREAYLKARDSGSLPGDMSAVVEQKLR